MGWHAIERASTFQKGCCCLHWQTRLATFLRARPGQLSIYKYIFQCTTYRAGHLLHFLASRVDGWRARLITLASKWWIKKVLLQLCNLSPHRLDDIPKNRLSSKYAGWCERQWLVIMKHNDNPQHWHYKLSHSWPGDYGPAILEWKNFLVVFEVKILQSLLYHQKRELKTENRPQLASDVKPIRNCPFELKAKKKLSKTQKSYTWREMKNYD